MVKEYNQKANEFKTVQVERIVDDRAHECIEKQLSETIKKVSLLIDTGADISINKVGELEDDAEILNNTQKLITGISEDPVTTIGTINLKVKLESIDVRTSISSSI